MAIGKLVQKDGKLLFSNGDLWSADDATTCDCECGADVPDPCPPGPGVVPFARSLNWTCTGTTAASHPANPSGSWTSYSYSGQTPTTQVDDPPTYSTSSGLRMVDSFRLALEYLPRLDFAMTFTHSGVGNYDVLAQFQLDAIYLAGPPFSESLCRFLPFTLGESAGWFEYRYNFIPPPTNVVEILKRGEPEWLSLAMTFEVLSYVLNNPISGLYKARIRFTQYRSSWDQTFNGTPAFSNSPSAFFTYDRDYFFFPCENEWRLTMTCPAESTANATTTASSSDFTVNLAMNLTYNAPP